MKNNQLKYPLLLVHGMGFRDGKRINYWGRIPEELSRLGANIYYGYQDSNAEIAVNAKVIGERIDSILQETGAQKVNIIAHSKGGLDVRYAIATLGYAPKVASLTTIATPHHGAKTMDMFFRWPKIIMRMVCFMTDVWFRLLGDKNPKTYVVLESFTTKASEKFNEENPDCPDVYYRSYAFAMKNPWSDLILTIPYTVVRHIEGENDGLVTPDSAVWGDFQGVFYSSSNRGISHRDEVDFKRRPFSRKSGAGVSDIVDIYKTIVCDLSERGF